MDDLISRQDAINELVRWGKIPDYNDGEKNVIGCVIGMLSTLPSAQTERKKGKWIYRTEITCSVCGSSTTFDDNFCSHCGADMREEKTNED